MKFCQRSDVTIVLTSCGRFNLLKRTLASLEQFNSYPIKQIIITEDSGSELVKAAVPKHWLEHTVFIINNPKLGQLKSVDAAYSQVTTPWVFHCEDDWEFYRTGFIEDSMSLLREYPEALQVWLRSYYHDLRIHSTYIYLSALKRFNNINYYEVLSSKADWQGFSFNPGLRRLTDYQQYAPYAQYSGEKELSRLYAADNRPAFILENDAVLHTGFGAHVVASEEATKKAKRKKNEKLKHVLFFILGFCFASLLNFLI
ncbi:hypothetical protein AKN90_04285 [Thiopseudomonas alkaliphila]|uniref:glycosyltransferase family 2 protein n=1 Tax=Thiopseudomonas alkaliphila TaxID=1697053 RepID=UPI00069CE57B|nr:hypothetical protein AKN90_04285 [Thiopseudomonas alkaliphila]